MDQERNYWDRTVRTSRLSRRGFLSGAAVAGAGAASLALVGCSSSSGNNTTPSSNSTTGSSPAASSATATATETPKSGGTFTDAFTGPFAGVDPHNSVYGGSGIVPNVYSYLVRDYVAFAPNPPAPAVNGIIQDLAVSQSLESDNLTWVFKIRPNVMIAANSEGITPRALDSSDVLASWNRIASASSGSNGYAFASKWIDKMDNPDPQTFRMIMKAPYAWTIANVGNNLIGAIVPKEWLENKKLKETAVGSGPFTLTELVESDHATMVKNPTYYITGKPYLDKHVVRSFAAQTTWRTAFTGNQIDAYAPADQDEAKSLYNANKQLLYSHSKGITYDSFWMRVNAAPWNDDRVRRAVNMAIDRSQFIELIGKGAGEPIGPITYAFSQYALSPDELKQAQPHDVAEAAKLFKAAAVTEFSFSYPAAYNVADYVNVFVRNMQAVGVKANAQALDAATWLAGYYTSKLTASLSLNQQYENPDFALQWFVKGGITGNGNYDTGYDDPDVDAAVKGAAQKLDLNERITAYKDTQKLILSKAPPFVNFFGLYDDVLIYPYIHNRLTGIGSLWYAYEDEIWTSKA